MAPAHHPSAMWVTVHREISPWDAHIVAGLLQAEGLNPFVHSAHHTSAAWLYSLTLGMVRVQVPQVQAEQAFQILHAWRQGEYHAALAAELALPEDVRCPRCRNYRWRAMRSHWSRALAVLLTFYFSGAAFPPELTGRRCRSCGLRQSLTAMDGAQTP